MIYIVIGVSTGIGYATAQELLNHGYQVVGVGRKNTITHSNYSFLNLDLSDSNAVESFEFPVFSQDFCLIYNAGVLGEIEPFSAQHPNNANLVFQVNYLAACAITLKLIQSDYCKQIIFISSGAAKKPIVGWSQYGASKAALNLFAETLQLELQTQKRSCRIMSIAPGVVDTPMQAQIRSTNERSFPLVQQFKDYYDKHELSTPEVVAQKLRFIAEHPQLFEAVCFSLRDVDLSEQKNY